MTEYYYYKKPKKGHRKPPVPSGLKPLCPCTAEFLVVTCPFTTQEQISKYKNYLAYEM